MRLNYLANALGLIMMYIGAVILAPIFIALYYQDFNSVLPFMIASFVSAFVGFALRTLVKNASNIENLNDIKKSEALFLVVLSWIVFGIISAIPYLFYGLSPINSLFEAVSGITTTGATILTHFDYPKAMFFWRGLTQWLGGMGIIVLFIAILPQFAVAGRQMFFAEAPGPTEDKFTPRIKHTATALWIVYIGLTVLQIIALKLAGMSLFDSVCNSFTTLAAGGFSPSSTSIMGYHSNLIHWIIILFMFLAGANFALQYKILIKGKFDALIKSEEFRAYLGFVLVLSGLLAYALFLQNHYHIFDAIRDGLFQVISLMTTTGFANVDFSLWSVGAKVLLFIAMLTGSCAGSAGGGIKIVRILLVFKYLKRELTKIMHPNAVINIKIDNVIVPKDVITQILGFVIFYMLVFVTSTTLVSIIEESVVIGITGSITTLGNIGPGFGAIIGPMGSFDSLCISSKSIFILNMLVGRLELIPFLVMLQPDFWTVKQQ